MLSSRSRPLTSLPSSASSKRERKREREREREEEGGITGEKRDWNSNHSSQAGKCLQWPGIELHTHTRVHARTHAHTHTRANIFGSLVSGVLCNEAQRDHKTLLDTSTLQQGYIPHSHQTPPTYLQQFKGVLHVTGDDPWDEGRGLRNLGAV